ncbi:hypothetical protein KIN20_018983 [Parelaphostrongylus tenuis]|uniref:Protein kinase domain-containing protein n=1 Tax=Parelaphostrongylus tenuis TaxID=148309 RepID=A0AAD5N4V9_PARTN|nr:hypothetical protein KIN20_018983 [Parelaphostrongylus tenuis]
MSQQNQHIPKQEDEDEAVNEIREKMHFEELAAADVVGLTPQLSEQSIPAIIDNITHSPSETVVKQENKCRIEKEEWYHRMIPIEDAQSMLHQNGDLLVRTTEREKKSSPDLERENISLEKKIGEGEYGEVWRGKLKTKTEESVDVAMKLVKVSSNTKVQIEMFHQEARLMRVYNHRNLVKLYGMVFSDRDVMVVMDWAVERD